MDKQFYEDKRVWWLFPVASDVLLQKKVNYLYKTEYIHKDTGANLSFDEEKMLKSSMSFIEVMKNIDPKFVKYAEKIEKVIKFKYDYKFGSVSKRC